MQFKIGSFESDRYLFEPRTAGHASEIFHFLQEKDLYHFMTREAPPSEAWLNEKFKALETQISPDGKEFWLGWVAKRKTDQVPVGLFEATIIGVEGFIAYTVFKPHWGQGTAVEASEAMINFLAAERTIKRFVIEMDTRNRSSMKVAEKLGFRFVQVVNNAGFLKGMVSHEFIYEKILS